MKPLKNMNNLSQQLKQLPQLEMPKDIFDTIQSGIRHRNFIRRHKFVSALLLVVSLSIGLGYVMQNKQMDEKDLLIQELVKRTVQLENLLAEETPTYSMPGSMITERIVNIESYLAKLDINIKKTRDKKIRSQLMATKLNLLGDLVLLQRKINQKPDYQKLKPYII